jgi:hemerythrin
MSPDKATPPPAGPSWSEALATGVPEIDHQHRELLGLADQLLAALVNEPSAVERHLDFLGDYVLGHFDAEERLMFQHGYPEAEDHREAHAGFARAFGRVRYDFDQEGLTEEMVELIGGMLVDWLKMHIREVDRPVGAWLVARGQADAGPMASGGTWVVPSGALLRVLSVTPGRSLQRAGMAAGDLIVAVGGRRVTDLGLTQSIAALSAPGARGLTLTVHPLGDRDRIETRFVPRQVAATT